MQKSHLLSAPVPPADQTDPGSPERCLQEQNGSTGKFCLAILLPMLTGAVSAVCSQDGMQRYKTMPKPALAPPTIVFPLVWTALYFMMGTASYYVLITKTTGRRRTAAVSLYLIQLTMNFFWSIIFFSLGRYTAAFIWLIIMYIAIIACTVYFFLINPKSGWLMLPYNIWIAFAAYLNLSIILLNP